MAHAKAEIGLAHYAVRLASGEHALVGDEPKSNGGGDAGPAPYDLLLMSLGACSAITLRMYADRKQWDLKSVAVDLHYVRADDGERIDRKVRLDGALSEEQRSRFAEIVERTPVTLTLKKGLAIATELVR